MCTTLHKIAQCFIMLVHSCAQLCAQLCTKLPFGSGANWRWRQSPICLPLVWLIASLPWVNCSLPRFPWLIASSSVAHRLFASFAMPTNMLECSHGAGLDAPHSFRNAHKRARMRCPCLETYVHASIQHRYKHKDWNKIAISKDNGAAKIVLPVRPLASRSGRWHPAEDKYT